MKYPSPPNMVSTAQTQLTREELQDEIHRLKVLLEQKEAECDKAIYIAQWMAEAIQKLSDRFGFTFKELAKVSQHLHRYPTYTFGVNVDVREPRYFRYTVEPPKAPIERKKKRRKRTPLHLQKYA